MKPRLKGILFVLFGLLTSVVPAFAHHSFSAEFIADDTKLIKITGVLSRVDWVNPHIYFYVDSKDENGQPVTWSFENFPPLWWRKYGLSKDMLKIGEVVTVEAYPAKDGTKHLGYGKIIHFADGHTIATMQGDPKDLN